MGSLFRPWRAHQGAGRMRGINKNRTCTDQISIVMSFFSWCISSDIIAHAPQGTTGIPLLQGQFHHQCFRPHACANPYEGRQKEEPRFR